MTEFAPRACCTSSLTSEDIRSISVVNPSLASDVMEASNAGAPSSDQWERSQHAPAVVEPLLAGEGVVCTQIRRYCLSVMLILQSYVL